MITFVLVENDSLITSNSQLFEKETDDNEFDLISRESLIMTDYNKNSISHSIPILSSSIKYKVKTEIILII